MRRRTNLQLNLISMAVLAVIVIALYVSFLLAGVTNTGVYIGISTLAATLGWMITNLNSRRNNAVDNTVKYLELYVHNKEFVIAQKNIRKFIREKGEISFLEAENILSGYTNPNPHNKEYTDIAIDIILILNYWQFKCSLLDEGVIDEYLTYSVTKIGFFRSVTSLKNFILHIRQSQFEAGETPPYSHLVVYAKAWFGADFYMYENDFICGHPQIKKTDTAIDARKYSK